MSSLHPVSQLSNQWIDIFAAGNQTDSEGNPHTFTDADLDDVVRNFDPSFHEPPVVIGHPKTDSPAFGWVEKLRRAGNVVQAKFKDGIDADFEEMVKGEKFKKRSASLYKTAKGLMLRHVGFLGAQPPAIKGLADIKFADEDSKSVSIDFEESGMAEVNEQSIVDKILAKLRGENKPAETAATTTFTEAQAKQIATDAVAAAIAPIQAKLDAQEVKFAESQKNATSADVKTRVANAIAKLKGAGKWVPAFDKLGVPVLFAELANSTETVEFGEAGTDGKLAKATPLDLFVTFMEQHQKIVPTSAVYTGAKPTTGAKSVIQFSEGKHQADQNSVDLANLAQDLVTEKKITFAEAMREVLKDHPELAIPGRSSAGQV